MCDGYRGWARFYDFSIGLDPAYRRNARSMLDVVVRDGDHVLDVGVGTGLLPEVASERSGLWTGLDYSGSMLARAAHKVAQRQLRRVTLRWGDARSLPFGDESFDAVVSAFVLPHFRSDERVRVLREAARTLKPGGRLGLLLAQGEHAPLFDTREELRRALEASGFEGIRIEDRDDVYRVATALSARRRARSSASPCRGSSP